MRQAVLDLHTNQIMDNLIRIRQGLPILHVDYLHMTGTISQTAGGTFGDSQSLIDNVTRTAAATFSHTLTNGQTYGASANQFKQLTVTAEPVLNNYEVYHAYLEFLSVPEHLVETPEAPPPGAALLVRCMPKSCCDLTEARRHPHKDKTYFWVPCEFRDAFFKLALFTVALRGEPIPVSPNFDVAIKEVLDKKIEPVAKGLTAYKVRVRLDRKIPNDNGYLIATVKGKSFGPGKEIHVLLNDFEPDVEPAQPGQRVTEKQKTDAVYLNFNTAVLGAVSPEEVLAELMRQKIAIHLDNFLPGGTRTERLLEDVRHQLELNRLDTLQLLPR